jgi:hypothetical protein
VLLALVKLLCDTNFDYESINQSTDQSMSGLRREEGSRFITPTAGFTVCGESMKRGGSRVRKRVYVNCCSHKRVARPNDKRNVSTAVTLENIGLH